MKKRHKVSYFYYIFFCFGIRKKEKESLLPFYHFFYYGIGERKVKDGIYNTCFSLFPVSSCKRKNENRHNGSYFYWLFFAWGLGKEERMISYTFSISHYKIKRKDGIYMNRSDHGQTNVEGGYPSSLQTWQLLTVPLSSTEWVCFFFQPAIWRGRVHSI